MVAIYETAYPRIKSNLTPQELDVIYTPSSAEIRFVKQQTKSARVATLGMLLQIKLCQRLGYFPRFKSIPRRVIRHVAGCANLNVKLGELRQYFQSATYDRHRPLVRKRLHIKFVTKTTREIINQWALSAAATKDHLADVINVLIEQLVSACYELPGFTVLHKIAQQAITQVNDASFQQITQQLSSSTKLDFNNLLASGSNTWSMLKKEPKKPGPHNFREYIAQVKWLRALAEPLPILDTLPIQKREQFALLARSYNITELRELKPLKRYALIVVLIRDQFARSLDNCAKLLIRTMLSAHSRAKKKLDQYRQQHASESEHLITLLSELLSAYQQNETPSDKFSAMQSVIGGDVDRLQQLCDDYLAYAGNNHIPFMLKSYATTNRRLLFHCLSLINLQAACEDQRLLRSIHFIQKHWKTKGQYLTVKPPGQHAKALVDIHWIPQKWWRLVTGKSSKSAHVTQVHKHYFELCVFSQIATELGNGDLYITHGYEYDDYRKQLLSWEEVAEQLDEFNKLTGLPTQADIMVEHLRKTLTEACLRTDSEFPANQSVRWEKKALTIRKIIAKDKSSSVSRIDKQLKTLMPQHTILDIISDGVKWLNLTQFFRPLSGSDSRITNKDERLACSLFCYGCNLGPTQTARSIQGFSRKQIAWLNHKQISEQALNKAIVKIINAYNQFLLPKYWGTGKHVSVDGSKWNLYENNLLSEFHIRYGGYGGIGYYHVSDQYIALFSHFIPCGVYEAIYMLDGLLKNFSDIQPDTVHGDTHSQNAPVFGLSYLLGIELMPRIRSINNLTFFKPDKDLQLQHIDDLFTETINWELIEQHYPEMLRIALSIKSGKISASTILRRFGTKSRKNKIYFAFRELGRVIRTIFLIKYIGDEDLRKLIHATTNKSEEFNNFAKNWLAFGGDGVIAENLQHAQTKAIKFNHLVANLVILHNAYNMTKVLHQLRTEGNPISKADLAALSPYRTEHINRFGTYVLNSHRHVEPIDYGLNPLS